MSKMRLGQARGTSAAARGPGAAATWSIVSMSYI